MKLPPVTPDRRKLEIAADLVLEQRHGTSLTEQERRLIRDGFLEQVERRYREEVASGQ